MQLSGDEHSPLKTQQFYFPGESLSMTDEDDEDTEVEELDVSLAMLGLEFVWVQVVIDWAQNPLQ